MASSTPMTCMVTEHIDGVMDVPSLVSGRGITWDRRARWNGWMAERMRAHSRIQETWGRAAFMARWQILHRTVGVWKTAWCWCCCHCERLVTKVTVVPWHLLEVA